MSPDSYFIYISSSTTDAFDMEILLAILNTAGRGQPVYGSNNSSSKTDLWEIPRAKKSRMEIMEKLQSIPKVTELSVVKVSNPVLESEVAEVRSLFTRIG